MLYKTKLIRNKIAKEREMQKREGLKYLYEDKEIRQYLAKKIMEEAQEVADEILCDEPFDKYGSRRHDRLKEELGDLTDVRDGVMKYFDMKMPNFEFERKRKISKKGDFSELVTWRKPTRLGKLLRPIIQLGAKPIKYIRSLFLGNN